MRFLVRLPVLPVLFVFSIQVNAQDIHFSQFYHTPVSLNPALAGFINQDYRLIAGYRNQWKQANATFATAIFSGDLNIPVGLKGEKLGIGLFLLNDQMGNQVMINNSAFVSASYIKPLDLQRRHKLSAGVQVGYVQKKLDYSSLYFGNQIKDYQVNTSLPSGEPLFGENFNYIQVNAGAFYKYRLAAGMDVHTGISFFSVNRPKENFVQNLDLNKLTQRIVSQTGMRYEVRENLFVHPELLFMFQSKAIDFNAGSMIEYEIEKFDATPQLGVWYRTRDAIIFMAGLRFQNYHVGFTYDMTTSSLNDIKDSPTVDDDARIGAFEIIVTYVGFLKRPVSHEHTVPCRFF